MSGRLVIALTLGVCFTLVGVALWKRAQGTSRVREFFGAQQAALIQHAPQVEMNTSLKQPDTSWHNISHAPGLIHLRATLVDDRYYQWPAGPLSDQQTSSLRRFRFIDGTDQFELSIDTHSGAVGNPATGRSVRLIEASRKAIEEYLKSIK